jgi:uncharacterized repeat protein (TIGR01451 family)
MKNYMKKIIIVAFAFILLFAGHSVFAATNVFNGQSGDCNPAVGIGIYPNVQQDSNGCWTATSVTADPGEAVNIAMYYHNNTVNSLHNVRGVIEKTQINSTTYKFTGKMYSTEGGSVAQNLGTVTLHLSSAESVTYSSTHWFSNEDEIDDNHDHQTFQADGTQMNIGTVQAGWFYQGEFLAVYKVGTTSDEEDSCVISNFSASPSSIDSGEESTLSWNTNHCVSASILGLVSVDVPSGTYEVSPTATRTYTLKAYASDGTSVTRTATVTVNDDGDDNNDDEEIPEADTGSVSNIDGDSAKIKGSVDMNDFDSGVVFFVYGQDEDQIGDVQDDYSTYNSVDEDDENLQKERVDTDLDGDESYSLEISNLEQDEDYFYSICVQYKNSDNDYELVCGDVKDFTSEEEDSDNDSEACEITQFKSNKTSISDGSSATLSWDTDGCDTVYISGLGNVNASGSRSVYPVGTTTYSMSAYNSDGDSDTASLTISVSGGSYYGVCGVTSIASGVTKTSATLNGITAGPSGSSASTYFEYGPTSSLGLRTSARNVSSGTTFSETVYGLTPGTLYYFRLISNCESGNKFGSTSTLRTASDTVPAQTTTTTVVHSTTTGIGSPIMLKIENRFEFVKRGDTINYTVTYKNIGKNTLKNSLIQVVVPEGIEMTNASQGSFSNKDHILNVPLGDLVKNAEGEIYLDAKINSITTEKLVSTATLVYTNPNKAQENAIAYVINIPKEKVSSLGAAALFGKLFSLSLVGWLLLILIVLIILLIVQKYFYKKDRKYSQS